MQTRRFHCWTPGLLISISLAGCSTDIGQGGETDDGPVAEGVSGKLGDPVPFASAEQLATFERGKAVFQRRFDLAGGLGPAFNVVSCGACHERPTAGGSAGLYRNFFLAGRLFAGTVFVPSESAGAAGGVLRVFSHGGGLPARPAVPDDTTIFAQRNAIPLFGVGLLAEISDDEILSRVDTHDADGDGISGRANRENGGLGRFGRKAQTASLEAFTRGPLFNHLGITSNPLTVEQRLRLPLSTADSAGTTKRAPFPISGKDAVRMQVAAPEERTLDADAAPDPEITSEDLLELVSFVMLLAAPRLDEPTAETDRGRVTFHEINCSACHVPRLQSPRGPLPVYSDLLIHDMGEELADGIEQGFAERTEFRTQPLWGIAAVGPYLHDGRADTIEEAILAHGGEARASRDAFAALSVWRKNEVVEFLLSLGGRNQFSPGLLQPESAVPDVGEPGGPLRDLSAEETEQFVRGRAVFDRDFGHADGVGAMTGADGGPRFNGDSCRACHVDPVMGGAGPRDVNVMRHGSIDSGGAFTAPSDTPNTILHKEVRVGSALPRAAAGVNVFEHRQTPTTLGIGLIGAVSDATILSNADPDDADGDGVSGRARVLDDGRIGRMGWKAQVPSVAEFVRDAMAAELGVTLPSQEADGLTFGLTEDDDGIADPELSLADAEDLAFFLTMLGPPPRQELTPEAEIGEGVFSTVGCATCHIATLVSALGDAPLFSDLLLHDILPAGTPGIEDGQATQTEFRTAPLWGLSQTAPYFHSGEADTIEQAIALHDGEAAAIRDAYFALPPSDRAALLAFLSSL